MSQEILDSLTAERDQLLDDLLTAGEEKRTEILGKIIEIDQVIESLKSPGDVFAK